MRTKELLMKLKSESDILKENLDNPKTIKLSLLEKILKEL